MRLNKKKRITNRCRRTNRFRQIHRRPRLRFSPTAWAKLLFLRDFGETEVGGFGISAAADLLLIEDWQLVHQVCSWAHVAFEDESVADYFDEQVDAGRQPEQFGRIWMHTHPGDCPRPSRTDEETFARVFGQAEWAIMFILAQSGQSYARLQFHSGPGASLRLPVEIDYSQIFPGCDSAAWKIEYLTHVQTEYAHGGPDRWMAQAADVLQDEF